MMEEKKCFWREGERGELGKDCRGREAKVKTKYKENMLILFKKYLYQIFGIYWRSNRNQSRKPFD